MSSYDMDSVMARPTRKEIIDAAETYMVSVIIKAYKGDTMEGTMEMVIQGAGMQVKNTISGRRIGDCD